MQMGNETKHFRIWQKIVISIAVSAITAIIASHITPIEFWGNDDTIMQAIMSGSTSGKPTPYAIFTNIMVGMLISYLFSIAPTIPWWFIFLEFNTLLSITVFSYVVLTVSGFGISREFSSRWGGAITLIGSIAFFWFFTVQPSYTFTAISLATASAICYLTTLLYPELPSREHKGLTAVYIALIFISCCIRMYCGLIGLAFIICTYIFFEFHTWKKSEQSIQKWRRSNIVSIILVIALATASWGVNRIAYSIGEWSEFSELNQARSVWMDFHRYTYDEQPELYQAQGWDENLYSLVYTWFFMDERIDKQSFEILAGNGTPPSFRMLISDFAHGTGTFSHAYPLALIAVLVSLTAAICVIGRSRWPVPLIVIPVGAAMIGLTILWLSTRTYIHVMTCALFPSVVYLWILFAAVIGRTEAKAALSKCGIICIAAYSIAIVILLIVITPRYVDIRYRFFIVAIIPTLLALAICSHKRTQSHFLTIALMSLLAISLFSASGSYLEVKAESDFRTQLEAQSADLRAYVKEHPDEFFVFYNGLYSFNAFEMTPKNAISWGGWEYYAPWRSIVAESISHPEGIYADVLLEPNVYYITDGKAYTEHLKKLLVDRTGKQVSYKLITQMDSGTSIYKYSIS